jgi:hypothetical protein
MTKFEVKFLCILIIDTLLHRKNTSPLPNHKSAQDLADNFLTFFDEKIKTIRASLETMDVTNTETVNSSLTSNLSNFSSISEEAVRKIIVNAKSTSCALDPIPTALLKQCLDAVVPVITKIINMSLVLGEVPQNMKHALVIPLLKKLLLDPDIFKNYRPISNLTFLSKITEKVVSIRTHEYMTANNLHEAYQSAYKQLHSTETALVRVHDDILHAVDDGKMCLIVLLDLSAAFDTVDHAILLKRLSSHYGVEGTALQWFRSYLTGRDQSVIINGVKSQPLLLNCSVPQGSILGPELFSMYAAPVAKIIQKHGLKYHIYADDTQLYVFFNRGDIKDAVQRIEACVAEIRTWMAANLLKFNDSKTEAILIGSHHQLKQQTAPVIHIGDVTVKPSTSVRNIGVQFDSSMCMEEHIIKTCQAANYHIRNIGRVRKYLTQEATEKLVHAFISSKIDYGNALLFGIPDSLLKRLQRIQNTAARVVVRASKYEHITPVLQKLHWLPVKQRVEFKIILLTFKALNGLAPIYISDLLKPYTPTRNLRSGGRLLLKEQRYKLKTYGGRAFSITAPKLWNSLPVDIKSCETVNCFKSKLKHYLYKCAFS